MSQLTIVRKHMRFTGRVQGVGFRYRAKYAANGMGITGWVRNEWDGSVEMEAQGTEKQINYKTTAQTKALSLQLMYKGLLLNISVILFMEYQAVRIFVDGCREETGWFNLL